ncbi:hypothetical protein [uncultured Roseobacter sp.]|uniref:hypothetical protein n=1 Tax=uncultured Roseobacter sp. TaxID=114847 RepID=UPI002614552C|nr:hypothetical protein [uncultured Roseobacter sp.]
MSDLRVLSGDGKTTTETTNELCQAIEDTVYSFAGRGVTVAAAIGVLEIAKQEILEEQS